MSLSIPTSARQDCREDQASTLGRSHCEYSLFSLTRASAVVNLPIRPGVVLVPRAFPGGDFLDQGLLAPGCAGRDTRGRQHATEFGFSPISSQLAVFGCVVATRTARRAAVLSGGGRFRRGEAGLWVLRLSCIEHDLRGLGEVRVGQFARGPGHNPRRRGAPVTLTCRQPSSGANIMNRLAVPLRSYLIVVPCGVSWLRRDRARASRRWSCFDVLVQADHGDSAGSCGPVQINLPAPSSMPATNSASASGAG